MDIAIKTIIRLFAVAEDRCDRRRVENDGKIVRHDVSDRTVRAALDGASADAVPQGDAMTLQKGALFGDRDRRFNLEFLLLHSAAR